MNNSIARHSDVFDFTSTGILALSVLISLAVNYSTRSVFETSQRTGVSPWTLPSMLFAIADGVYFWLNKYTVSTMHLVYAFRTTKGHVEHVGHRASVRSGCSPQEHEEMGDNIYSNIYLCCPSVLLFVNHWPVCKRRGSHSHAY